MSNLSLSSSDWIMYQDEYIITCIPVLFTGIVELFTFLMVHMYTFCGLIIATRIKKYTKAFLSFMNRGSYTSGHFI